MKKIFPLFLILLAGCVSTTLSPEGARVRFVERKPKNCESLGKFDTTGYHVADKKIAEIVLKNEVADMGGNTARISDTLQSSYQGTVVLGPNKFYGFRGYAYKCPR